MLENAANALQIIISSVQQNWRLVTQIIGIAFLIQLLNASMGYRLNFLGIYPRRAHGLIGVFFTPVLHGSFQHLFFNAIPFTVLGCLVLVSGRDIFFEISSFIIIMSGLLIWIFGRPAFHIGASSLVVGYWGFLLSNAYQQHSIMSLLLALLCLYYFSSIIFSLFPGEEKTSWEGHVFGFLSGLAASYALNHGWFIQHA